ncbi:hypothetical protein Hanom_Chr08g00715651 [Helianthus anomalus]
MSTEEPSHRSSHRKRASLRIGESNTSPETRHPHGTRIFMSELEDDTAILTGSRARRRRVATRIRYTLPILLIASFNPLLRY